MRIFVFALLIFVFNIPVSHAQDTLPKITVLNVSKHVLISWVNPYSNLTVINIQRSFDSTKNFKTLATLLDVKSKKNGYADAKPPSQKMFYRVFISFEGGSFLFTKSYRPTIDTLKTLPDIISQEPQTTVIPWFTQSSRVFTGKDNNVIIVLPQARVKKYTLKFFEENGSPAFEINKIPDPYLILERVNFMHSGIFNFELFEDGLLLEKDKVYIAKDSRSGKGSNETERPPR